MSKLATLLLSIILPMSIYAETPPEIQGVWVPDIEKTIVLMNKNMGDIDSVFMRGKYLPHLERTITKDHFINTSGKREHKAGISLEEKKGATFIMLLTSESAPDMLMKFIPKENDTFIMMSENPADGSGNILWKRQ